MRTKVVPSEEIDFDSVQRSLHWGLAIGITGLLISGLPIYLAQFLVYPPVPTPLTFVYWGLLVAAWRTLHIYLALTLVGLVAFHAFWDAYHLNGMGRLKPSIIDLNEAMSRARNFFGFSSGYDQPTARYDFFQA